jgi:hypothetical protein
MLIFLDKAKTTTDISIGNIEQVEHGNCLIFNLWSLDFTIHGGNTLQVSDGFLITC